MKKHVSVLAALAAVSLTLTACSGSGSDSEAVEAADLDAETQSLVDEAQDAGPVTLYSMVDEAVLREVAADFESAYGITVEPVRLVSADLAQRFSSEASTGSSPADLIMLTDSPFYDEALEEGWISSFAEAELPDSLAGDFPEDLYTHDGSTPMVSFVPTETVYNTDLVESAPTSWEDYADPAYAGKLQIAEVDSSPANVAFWSLMRNEFGDELLEGIAANNPTVSGGAVPGTQAVAAGEGALGHPGVLPVIKNLQESGAPVEVASMSPTTGPEVGLGLAENSPNPAGAKLLAAYLMSEEGNLRFNESASQISPFDAEGMDRFTRTADIEMSDAAELKSLMGMN
ncbi:extracellular solute-binding protein [Citricoccus nitrophenolicus]|uniref:Extracellular solute-binding protein n=1 Tax=Citricoccus nitrophenolicus TaxID=863575 RepID=A0ABV0IIS1_9MICC|nr:extracellular solute-binding protein [Citricoccus sp. I39-566]WMY78512.1 extracellular solute-binding protein [Citricoccus sp. I39-566]